jgi:anti-anti-sigma factor
MSSHEEPPSLLDVAESPYTRASLSVRHRHLPGRHTIVFEGVLDLSTASAAAHALIQAADGGCELVLDLSAVSFLDSAGLHAILTARERCHRSGGSLRLSSASPQVRALLARTGLLDHLSLQPLSPG